MGNPSFAIILSQLKLISRAQKQGLFSCFNKGVTKGNSARNNK
jgi:hypothetical protein